MPRPEDCRFTESHEWACLEGDCVTVGITDFAQDELGDIVYVELPEPGRKVAKGEELGTIESVKAVAEIFAPIDGEVTEVNGALADAPEQVNKDPFGAGWLVKLRPADPAQLEALMDHAAYKRFLETSA
ncbi:MAG: glycine cleavage system protein GcvH [Acidobacteria bacterium]|nr:MAG: glycine cleavage system protein GcvH [Acidobacteriota bacterium]